MAVAGLVVTVLTSSFVDPLREWAHKNETRGICMAAEEVVRVDKLVKRYGELCAVDHLDMSVRQGEIFGLLGPNGSGKTTAINCILQLLRYDHGSISVFGQSMTQIGRAHV